MNNVLFLKLWPFLRVTEQPRYGTCFLLFSMWGWGVGQQTRGSQAVTYRLLLVWRVWMYNQPERYHRTGSPLLEKWPTSCLRVILCVCVVCIRTVWFCMSWVSSVSPAVCTSNYLWFPSSDNHRLRIREPIMIKRPYSLETGITHHNGAPDCRNLICVEQWEESGHNSYSVHSAAFS